MPKKRCVADETATHQEGTGETKRTVSLDDPQQRIHSELSELAANSDKKLVSVSRSGPELAAGGLLTVCSDSRKPQTSWPNIPVLRLWTQRTSHRATSYVVGFKSSFLTLHATCPESPAFD